MSDIIIPAARWTPPGGVARLDQPGQRLTLAPGLTYAEVIGQIYITSTAAGAEVDPRIRVVLPANHPQASAIDICASRARVGCEIDLSGLPKQGVQIVRYPATADPPADVDLSGLRVYNNTQNPAEINHAHGVYLSECVRAHGKNLLFRDIKGGWALHFYPGPVTDCVFEQITTERCAGDVIYWGTTIERNAVKRLLTLNVGASGVVTYSNSTPRSNTVDYVTQPTAGYGYQTAAAPPTTRVELDAAWAEWQQATLYKTWRRQNPLEAAALDAYRAGGPRPSLATATGRALVHETAAWLSSSSAPEETP